MTLMLNVNYHLNLGKFSNIPFLIFHKVWAWVMGMIIGHHMISNVVLWKLDDDVGESLEMHPTANESKKQLPKESLNCIWIIVYVSQNLYRACVRRVY